MIDFKRCPDGMPCSGNCMPFGCQRDARPAASESETPETDALVNSASCSTPLRVGELIDFARSLERRLRREKHAYDAQVASSREYLRSIQAAIVDTVGGTVEGKPTHEGNYLQRLRGLVQSETQLSLAQTEIKRHMRIEDDLQARIAALENMLQRALSSLRSYDSKLADHIAALKDRA